jgi:hypothetical protein
MAHWHALAKLRLHTDITLAAMDSITVLLGIKLRLFQSKTCPAFSTRELIREKDARVRRQNPKSKTNGRPSVAVQNPAVQKSAGVSVTRDGGRREKTFNLNTYKFHALGDYAATIRQFGTTDSYSTEMVSPFPTVNVPPFLPSPLRANWNIEHPNDGIFGPVAKSSPSN